MKTIDNNSDSSASVLLISSLSDAGNLVEPVAMEYLAAYCIQHNRSAIIHCCLPEDTSIEEILIKIGKIKPSIVGLTMWVINADFVTQVCRRIKKEFPEVITFVGGYHARFASRNLEASIDTFILGEGEIALLNLIKSVESGVSVERIIEGIPIENLDLLPLPARYLVNFEEFPFLKELESPNLLKNQYTYVFTYRGCPLACTFCGIHEVYGRKINRKSVSRVMEELYQIADKYQINAFVNEEDLLFLDKQWVLSWCDSMCKSSYKFSWTCSGSVRHMDEEILTALKLAGCKYVFIGSISGSDTILKSSKVGFNTKHLRKALEVAERVGMPISSSLMIGFPEETKDTLQETSNFLEENRDLYWDIGMGIVRAYSGTPLLIDSQLRSTPEAMLYGSSLSPSVDIEYLRQFIENHRKLLNFTF